MRIRSLTSGAISLLAAMLLLTGFSISPVVTQENKSPPDALSETYGPWILNCGAGLTGCHVFQALFRAKDNARLVQVTVFAPVELGAMPVMRALVPLGATISEGVLLQIDDAEPARLPFHACWQRGCVAELPLATDLEARMRQGQTLAISVQGADKRRTLRFELALNGIGAALDRLRAL